MSDEIFLQPDALRSLAAQIRSQGAAVEASSGREPLHLPGDDGGLGAAVTSLLAAEAATASVAAAQFVRMAGRLESIVTSALRADRHVGR